MAAHSSCNGRKRDHLASTEHAESWTDRLCTRSSDLEEIARAERWWREPRNTFGVAAATYNRLSPEALLWQSEDRFEPPDLERLRRAIEKAFRCLPEHDAL